MAGIAIIMKGVTLDNNLGNVTFLGQVIPITSINISASSATVPLNASSITLGVSLTPANTTQKGIAWSVVSGGNYASVSQDGIVTLSKLADGAKFKIKAASTYDTTIYAEKEFTVVSSNMLTTIKNGKKFNTTSKNWDDNADYISSDWIDVQNCSVVTLTMPTSVEIANQTGSTNNTIKARIGIVYEDMNGDFHTLYMCNNLVATTFSGGNTYPLNIPTRIMKRMHIFSLLDGNSINNTNNLIAYKASDWSNGNITVYKMSENNETYGNDFLMPCLYAGSTLSGAFMRNSGTAFRAFSISLKAGDKMTLKTKGGSSAKAYNVFDANDGSVISTSEANADFSTTAYEYTASKDVIVTGSCASAAYDVFSVLVTKVN